MGERCIQYSQYDLISNYFSVTIQALIAQLGERQTEDLKVAGSIPAQGNHFFLFFPFVYDNSREKLDSFFHQRQPTQVRTTNMGRELAKKWPVIVYTRVPSLDGHASSRRRYNKTKHHLHLSLRRRYEHEYVHPCRVLLFPLQVQEAAKIFPDGMMCVIQQSSKSIKLIVKIPVPKEIMCVCV